MVLFYSPALCKVISNPLFGESRLCFLGVEEAHSVKPGIRFHNSFTAFILRILFGEKKIIDITDVDGKIYHLNRRSLTHWLEANDSQFTKEADTLRELALVRMVDKLLKNKSPQCVVQLSNFKYDLEDKERMWGIVGQWPDLPKTYRQLPAQIAQLKEEVAKLQIERAKLK